MLCEHEEYQPDMNAEEKRHNKDDDEEEKGKE